MNRLTVYSYLTQYTHWNERSSKGSQTLCQENNEAMNNLSFDGDFGQRTTDKGQTHDFLSRI